jgi:acyl-CoA synthetase (AMP-forming)/AMP-acid ligase II
MLYCLTLQHALRQFPDSQAFSGDAGAVTFCQIADRVERVAGELFDRGFRAGDRLAILLPNTRCSPMQLLKASGVRFIQSYGLTEASPLLTLLADEDHKPDKLLSCGRPIFGVELDILDSNGKPCPPNEPGEIVARGLNIRKGYWNKPKETARAIVEGWFPTGAIAQRVTSHCRQRLANYKIPRRVEFFPTELPKSGTGKILKRELRAPFWKDRSRAVG